MGRNTAAAIALATAAIDRADDEVMIVVPADAHIDPERRASSATCCARPRSSWRPGAFDIDDPLVTLGDQVTRAATEYGYLAPELRPRCRRRRAAGVSARGVRGEAEGGPCRGAPSRRASPGMRASSCGGGGRSAPRSSGTPGWSSSSARSSRAPALLAARLRAAQARLDRLRRHGGRRARRPGRDGLDGCRLVRPRLVDGAAGGDRRPVRAPSSRPARRSTVAARTSSCAASTVASGSSRRPSAVA